MPLFSWDDCYSVADEALDRDHRQLFALINGLYDECMHPDSAEIGIRSRIEELHSYALSHFEAEEEHMRNIGFAGFDSHALQHQAFIRKISSMQQAYPDSSQELVQELIVFVGKWLINHVMKEDRSYAARHGS